MATVTARAFEVVALDDIEPGHEHDGRVPLNVRAHFDIRASGSARSGRWATGT